eukprot:TRINITY_DN17800_c0_g1_i1.p1 TRINITY_DN17800_c0_g1~~TRINITY_DN17800_c0_g1_i1.p1  ORF type:complete len:216 (-),score=59.65 TRINITY_DN17800_c0_g1_i1:396-1043(-)
MLLFLPAYTYLTQFAIPEAEAKKKVRRAKAAAAEAEVEAEKAKAAEGRVVEPVMPRAMRGAWGDGGVGAGVGEVDGQALMQATAQQQAEAQQAWEQQRRAAMALAGGEGGQSPVGGGGDAAPLLPALGSAPMRSAGDGPAHQMFPSVKDGAEDALSAADELALREVELAVKLKKLRSLSPSASVDAEQAELVAEVASVTAAMRALGVSAPGSPPT